MLSFLAILWCPNNENPICIFPQYPISVYISLRLLFVILLPLGLESQITDSRYFGSGISMHHVNPALELVNVRVCYHYWSLADHAVIKSISIDLI